jgi:demethylmenaquinone methyltransferase/2-methoxy-6-polyprenyl-1,4-benzoquinol methylase/phosphoethanolamine N-methyltransferase
MHSIVKTGRINLRSVTTTVVVLAGTALLLRQLRQHLHPTQGDSSGVDLQTSGRTIHWATLYDPFVKLLTLGKDQKVRDATVELAQISPGESILDVGCGTGQLTRAAKDRAGSSSEVAGIDASAEMITVARRKALENGTDVDFQPGLIERLPFADDQFDLVLSSLMVHHLPDDLKELGFGEIYRVLKPGGRLLVVDFEPPAHPLARSLLKVVLGQGMMRLDVRQYAPLMETAGFAEVETGPTATRWLSFAGGRKLTEELRLS